MAEGAEHDKARMQEIELGVELPPLVKIPSALQLFRFSAETRNAHRIHYDVDYARSEGHAERLVQSHLLGAFMLQAASDWAGPAARIRACSWSNRRPCFPGDRLTCGGRITRVEHENGGIAAEIEMTITNQSGELCVPGQVVVVCGANRK